jgi:hypothetical protein
MKGRGAAIAARAKDIECVKDFRPARVKLLAIMLALCIDNGNVLNKTGADYILGSISLVLFQGPIGRPKAPDLLDPTFALKRRTNYCV